MLLLSTRAASLALWRRCAQAVDWCLCRHLAERLGERVSRAEEAEHAALQAAAAARAEAAEARAQTQAARTQADEACAAYVGGGAPALATQQPDSPRLQPQPKQRGRQARPSSAACRTR